MKKKIVRIFCLLTAFVFIASVAHGYSTPANVTTAYYSSTDNPFALNENVGQCTWYVYGRIQETGLITYQKLSNLGIFLHGADTWYSDATSSAAKAAGFTTGSQPQLGAIAYWNTGGHKHVAFVENISGPQVTQSNFTPTQGYQVVINGYMGYAYVNLRQSTNHTSTLVWKMPQFTVMNITGPPVTADGYQWFPMTGNGYTGWAALLDANTGAATTIDTVSDQFIWNFTRIQLSPGALWLSNPDGYIYLPSQDTTPPTVSAFNVTPTSVTVGSTVNISFTVSDTGGSGLSVIYLFRAPDASGSPGTWAQVGPYFNLSGNGPVSNTFSDTPAAGKWWYGFIVYDGSGNWNNEQNQETGYSPDFPPVQVTVTAAPANISVTIQPNPSGRSFTVDGTPYTTSQTFSWVSGSNHTIAATSPQSGGTGIQYVWSSWSDGGAMSHTVAPTGGTTYTANFTTQYYLTMSMGTGGSSISPGSGWYNSGASVGISATAASGYSFSSWTGSGSGQYSGSSSSSSVTMNAPITETASFTATTANISVTIQPNPSGRSFTVDGTPYTTSQTFSWVSGSNHTIAATSPQSGGTGIQYVWSSWSDGGAMSHTVAPTGGTTYTANFTTQYYLTMSMGTGGSSISPGSGWYNSGASVGISATAASGYSFSSWTGSGSGQYSGSSSSSSVTMNAPITETASFTATTANISVTIQPNPSGRSFTVDGTPYTTSQTFSWVSGSNHTIAATSPQSGGTGIQYVWSSWSDGGAMSHTVAPTGGTTYTANFTTQYYLTMSMGTGGSSISPGSGWYNSGASVGISATAASGYSFSSWTGSGSGQYSGSSSSSSVTMNAPITETASFTATTANISVTIQPNPSGRSFTVDGTPYTTSQTFSWVSGSNHTIAATSPQSGGTGIQYVWSSWSDGGAMSHTVAPTGGTTYTANFTTQYYLTMSMGTGGSSISPGSGWYNSGASVGISATAASGYSFSSWTGSGSGQYSGSSSSSSVTMNAPITETASFTATTANPSAADIAAQIRTLAQKYQIPANIIAAIAWQENKWTQFDASGNPSIGLSGDVGIMQINVNSPALSFDVQRVHTDWIYNMDVGCQILNMKFRGCDVDTVSPYDTVYDTDPSILENWYYPIARYNGEGTAAYSYVTTVWSFLKSLPDTVKAFFNDVPELGDPTTLGSFPTTIYENIPYPSLNLTTATPAQLVSHGMYTLIILAQNGQRIHQWNWATSTAGDITSQIDASVPVVHTVTPVAAANGTIYPNTPQTVPTLGGVTFTASPATISAAKKSAAATAATTTYVVDQWSVNGIPAQSGGTNFTLPNVTADTAVQVTFKPAPPVAYTVTPSAAANGSISPDSEQSIANGDSVTFTCLPDPGYAVDQWQINDVAAQSGGTSFTLTNVTAPTAVQVTFKAVTAGTDTITASPVPAYGGTASGEGAFTAGSRRTVAATANPGYSFINWTENGIEVNSLASYTFSLTTNRNLVANFTATPAIASDTDAPTLVITQPYSSGVFVTTNNTVNLAGIASDLGHGNNGISIVTVNGVEAIDDTTANGGTANWYATVPLNPGTNIITVVAKDTFNNSSQQQITVTYTPSQQTGSIQVTKCTIAAGSKDNSDAISLSGTLDTTADDISTASTIEVTINSDNIVNPCVQTFPISAKTFKKGKFNCSASNASFALDTKTSKFSFTAKNVDLSGLSCPLTAQIKIGNYNATVEVDETIVNVGKPIPINLLVGVKNSLRVDNSKFTRDKNTGNITQVAVSGGFSDKNVNDANLLIYRLNITLGSQTFTIPPNTFKNAKGKFTCSNVTLSGGEIAAATFDFNKCTFILTIKNTDFAADAGITDFGIIFGGFSVSDDVVTLPPP